MNTSDVTSGRPALDPLHVAARQLETRFVSDMLKSAGIGEARSEFGGGVGEEQFASFMRDAQAKAIVEGGGFGLTDAIYRSLLERAND